jgi:cellulase/cellobiase CelA1
LVALLALHTPNKQEATVSLRELMASGAECTKRDIALVMEQFLDQRRRQLDRARRSFSHATTTPSSSSSSSTSSSSTSSSPASTTSTSSTIAEQRWLEGFLAKLEVERERNEAIEAERTKALHGDDHDDDEVVQV